MMFQNKNSQANNDLFSKTMQRRMEMMLQNADRLFSLGWLRKQLWRELTKDVNSVSASEYGNFRQILRGSYESCFVWEFLSVYRKSLPDIRKKIDNVFEGTNPLEELIEEREELIMEFARMPLSRGWEYVKDDNKSWHNFACRMPLNDFGKKDEISHFFETIDRICVITDIVCGHAKEYGLEVDYSTLNSYYRQQKRAQLTDERLASAIESISYHLSSYSAWAVVYCVLRDDYGFQNQSQFERDVPSLPFKKQMKECPEGTVSKTMSNNDYMQKPIDRWPPDKKFTKVAKDIRSAIKAELNT